MKTETFEALGGAGGKATVAGAGLTGWGWIVSNEFFGLMGVVIALVGLLMQLYYKRKADVRVAKEFALRAEEHAARQAERQMRIELMRATGRPIAAPPDEPDTDMGHLMESDR